MPAQFVPALLRSLMQCLRITRVPAAVRLACVTAHAVVWITFSLAVGAVTYDLKSQWSNTSNPNGVWTLRDGNNVMPVIADVTYWSNSESAYNPPGGHIPQPEFVYGNVAGNHTPLWMKAAVTPNGDATNKYDWQAGDIVLHTADTFNGPGRGDPNVLWTSPSAGTARIYGNVWDGRTSLRRVNFWELWVTQNSVSSKLASGVLYGTDTDGISRANPAVFDIPNVALAKNDTVMLKFYRSAAESDFIGTNLTIELVSPIAARIAAGNGHSAAVKTDGSLWTWGNNGSGRLGTGTLGTGTNSLMPQQIGTGYASVAAGYDHTVALKTDGSLWVWGDNYRGQIGDGASSAYSASPKQIAAGYAAISAGVYHTIALKSDGTLMTWGSNGYGELGDGSNTESRVPKQIGIGYAAIAAGSYHNVALKSDGSLWAWGNNTYDQLGDGTTTQSLVPKQIATGYTAIAAAGAHTIALKSDGSVWTWGRNESGQLGDGTIIDSHVPKQIGTGYTGIAAGSSGIHSFAFKSDGSLWAWGNNASGQLGDGTTTNGLIAKQIGVGYTAVSAGGITLLPSSPTVSCGRGDITMMASLETAQLPGASCPNRSPILRAVFST